MTVEKSAPRINQINFYYDEDGNVSGAAAHVTYDLVEAGVVFSSYSESISLQGLTDADFLGLTSFVPTIREHVVSKNDAAAAAYKATLDAIFEDEPASAELGK